MPRMKRKEKNKKNQSTNQSYLKHPLREICFGVFIVSTAYCLRCFCESLHTKQA